MTATLAEQAWRRRPSRETLAWGALVVNAEILAVLAYLVINAHRVTITRPIMLVLPWIWINVGIWALVRTSPSSGSRRQRLVAGALALGYLLVLAYVSGMVRPATGVVRGYSVSVWEIPPGWGPYLFYDTGLFELSLFTYRVVGYVALGYLVYATVLDASNAILGGVLGLFSCVSCTFPVIAAVLSGVAGGGALAGAVSDHLYLASTTVYVVTVALLYWRPDPRRLWQRITDQH